jgi:serine phosphatase RsbU (regulator of sigma subunit)
VAHVPAGSHPLARLLRAQQDGEPDALAETLTAAVAAIGGADVVVYLIDYEHAMLVPHPDVLPHGQRPELASVEGTMAGRAFTSAVCQAARRDDGWHVWIPIRERANYLGVLATTLPDWDEDVEQFCLDVGLAAANLITASARYTDLPHVLRRRKRMDLAAEMQWSLLPPLSFDLNATALAGLVEPAYEVGGDAFDYAYNHGVLDIALFDTIGHGVASATLAALAVGAYRQSRRRGKDLPDLAGDIDQALRAYSAKHLFATALLARLDTRTGTLDWISCGHPPPLFTRDGTCLPDNPDAVPGLPAGLGDLGRLIGSHNQTALQPGDGVLFFSDGVVEARNAQREPFGDDRLRDLLAREHRANLPTQETVWRLVKASMEHAAHQPHDDATMLYLRWSTPQQPT